MLQNTHSRHKVFAAIDCECDDSKNMSEQTFRTSRKFRPCRNKDLIVLTLERQKLRPGHCRTEGLANCANSKLSWSQDDRLPHVLWYRSQARPLQNGRCLRYTEIFHETLVINFINVNFKMFNVIWVNRGHRNAPRNGIFNRMGARAGRLLLMRRLQDKVHTFRSQRITMSHCKCDQRWEKSRKSQKISFFIVFLDPLISCDSWR